MILSIHDEQKIQLSARMKIREGKLEGFKRQVAVCISYVKEKDPGTLQYDWFLNSDNTECEIREVYMSSEALLAHKPSDREPLEIVLSNTLQIILWSYMEIHRLKLCKQRTKMGGIQDIFLSSGT